METFDRSPGTVAIALVATTAVQAFVTMATLTVSVFAPEAAKELGVAPENIGLYASITYIGAMIGTVTAGGFVRRYGAIRFSQISMVVCAAGLLICTGGHWSLFLIAAMIGGLGYGPTTPASSHVLSRHTPPRFLSLVFSIKQTGVPLGGLLAGLLVPLFLAWYGWRGAAASVVAIVVVSAILLQFTRRRFDFGMVAGEPLLRGNVMGPLRLVFARKELRLLVIGSFLFAASQQSYIYFLVTYLETGIGWTNQQAGFALSVLGAAAVIGRVAWGALADATGRSQFVLAVIALGMAVSSAATAFFAGEWPSWAVFIVCAAFGATGVGWNGVYIAEITRRVAPDEVTRATGGGLFVTFAGVVTAPAVFSIVVHMTGGYSAAYLILAAGTFVVGVLMLRPEKKAIQA